MSDDHWGWLATWFTIPCGDLLHSMQLLSGVSRRFDRVFDTPSGD